MNVTANNCTHYQFAFKEIDKKQREGVLTFERPACFNVNQPFLGRKATYGLNFMVASQSDMSPTTFRKWWSTYGFADAPPNTFGPASASSLSKHALSRAEQIDPWIYHAKNCIICRRALGQMRVLQKVLTVGTAIGVIFFQKRPPFAIASVLIGIYAHTLLQKLATTIEGNPNRAEIGDRSFSATH